MNVNKIELAPGETLRKVDFGCGQGLYEISLAEGSSLHLTLLSLSEGDARYDFTVNLNGKGAECTLNGLYTVGDTDIADITVAMNHNAEECRSSQLFKGIISGTGHSKFDGIIKVVPGAQRTEAYQANHNLLLSSTARAESKPQLEIYADDVKCSHGATVGQLNEDELFYMRSRGISYEEARKLQIEAFAAEVIPEEAREEVLDAIHRIA